MVDTQETDGLSMGGKNGSGVVLFLGRLLYTFLRKQPSREGKIGPCLEPVCARLSSCEIWGDNCIVTYSERDLQMVLTRGYVNWGVGFVQSASSWSNLPCLQPLCKFSFNVSTKEQSTMWTAETCRKTSEKLVLVCFRGELHRLYTWLNSLSNM